MITHLFHIPIAHQGRFNALNAVTQLREGNGLAVIEALAITPSDGNSGRLIEALLQQQRQQGGQNTGVFGMEGVAKARKDRGHVFGGLDVLPLDVVHPR